MELFIEFLIILERRVLFKRGKPSIIFEEEFDRIIPGQPKIALNNIAVC